LLRLTAPRAVVPILLEPLIASFCQAYPEVEVEIAASADLVDTAAEGFDAGVRLGQFIEADMIAVRLTPSFPLAVVGSPDYLRRRQRPELIDDLRRHACLRMRRSNGSITPWSFVKGNEAVEVIVSGPFIANDLPTVLGAAVEGLGLAQAPGPIAAGAVRTGKLVRVLEPFAPMAPGVFLYYPGNRQMMPKLRAFVDHVKSRSGATNKTPSAIDDKPIRGMKMR
jgi:DNA-binding transcriptional LysR family regulator